MSFAASNLCRFTRPGWQRWFQSAAASFATALATLLPPTAHSGDIAISQFFGGGGNSGAPWRSDFIELFNRGTNTVNLTGWSVQYASASGTSWQITPLAGVMEPGQYYLIQQATGSANGSNLPPAEVTGSISMAASAGKVALVQAVTALSGSCPAGPNIHDLVGYATTASCFEGSGPAPAPGNTIAIFRAGRGCFDSGDNMADFLTGAPAPRNGSSPRAPCETTTAIPLRIHDIQGIGLISPYVGEAIVITNAIVTALRTNAVFIQSPDAESDGNPLTSEGILVSITGSPSPASSRGDAVAVQGIVQEFTPGSDPGSPPRTQIVSATFTMLASNQPLPLPAEIRPADSSPGGGLEQFERFEGMRVRISSLTTVSGTEGFVVESSAIGASLGVFQGVLPGVPRPFREPGVSLLDLLPPDAPTTLPRFDMNPERIRVDSNAQPGAASLRVTSGATVSNLVGVLDFDSRLYTLLPDPDPVPVVSGNRLARAVPPPTSGELTVACFNLQRFYDTVEDPAVSDVVLSPTAFNNRLRKLSLAIRRVLLTPDILGVEEVENLPTLQAVATRIDADAIANGDPAPNYSAFLFEGNDPGGIDVGVLIKTNRVNVLEVLQLGKTATYLNPNSGQLDTLNDRPPLLARVSIARGTGVSPLELTVIVNHLRSLSGINDPADGFRVRAKRLAQAEHLAEIIQSRQSANPAENIILVGDFNAFQFNDGYVDVMGVVKGTPANANLTVLAGPDRVDPDMVNLIDELPEEERYTYVFDGNAQTLDHIVVNQTLHRRVSRITIARNNADFPETYRSDPSRPERISDHDMPMAYIHTFLPLRLTGIHRGAGGLFVITGEGPPGTVAGIEASNDLKSWQRIETTTIAADEKLTFTDPSDSSPSTRFYRLIQP